MDARKITDALSVAPQITPQDVKAVAEPVLAHRITVKPEMWMSQISGHTVVHDVVSTVPTPAALEATPEHP